MALEGVIFAALTGDSPLAGLVGTRVYPVQAPQGAALPYMTFQAIAGGRGHDLDGRTADGRHVVQLDVFAASHADARAITEALETFLDGWADATTTPPVEAVEPAAEEWEWRDLSEQEGAGQDALRVRLSGDVQIWTGA